MGNSEKKFMISEKSGYFAVNDEWRYATLSRPKGEKPQRAVLVLAPFGEERKFSARLLVDCARTLAKQNCGVLRFDYRGVGESTGGLENTTMDHWLQDARCAWDILGRTFPGVQRSILGFRLGANIGLHAELPEPDRLVLCEPLPDGARFLEEFIRQKQIREMYGGGQACSEATNVTQTWKQGEAVDFGGYWFSAALALELQRWKLSERIATFPLSNASLYLLHLSAARRLAGVWKDVARVAAGKKNCHLATLAEKPFWGRLEYRKPENLINELVSLCCSKT